MRDLINFIYRFRSPTLFVFLMFLSLVLLFGRNNHHRAWYFTSSNSIAGDALTLRSDVADYMDLKSENEKLRLENANARSRNRLSYSPVENKFVRIQDTILKQEYRYLESRIVNSTFSKQQNYLTLRGGKKAGIKSDMGVVGHDGIIGVVQHVGNDYTLAMSILNTQLEVSVEVERTGHFGILIWNTNDPQTATVRDIAKHANIHKGDRIISRGSGGIFPRGIPVGEVIDVESEPGANYLDIRIMLDQDMTKTSHAYVVVDMYRLEKDSLENLVDP